MIQAKGIPWGDLLALGATRLALSTTWRTDRQLAQRLEGFAATEAGSALDMLEAAELVGEPRLRRLFLRHATDEARHAFLFRRAARGIHPDGARALPEHALIRATRQRLFTRYGLVRFLAFVHLAERRAARQFEVIRAHHSNRADVVDLFDQVLRDERFHVAYTKSALARIRREGRGGAVRWALVRARAQGAWEAWRRVGRKMGEVASRVVLLLLFATTVPLFALLERTKSPALGWRVPSPRSRSVAAARRES